MSKKRNLKVEKARRNEEYAERFKKRKRRPSPGYAGGGGGGTGGASRPAPVPTDRPERPGFEAVCATCGTHTTVPFKPFQGRPVLCRSCFQAA